MNGQVCGAEIKAAVCSNSVQPWPLPLKLRLSRFSQILIDFSASPGSILDSARKLYRQVALLFCQDSQSVMQQYDPCYDERQCKEHSGTVFVCLCMLKC